MVDIWLLHAHLQCNVGMEPLFAVVVRAMIRTNRDAQCTTSMVVLDLARLANRRRQRLQLRDECLCPYQRVFRLLGMEVVAYRLSSQDAGLLVVSVLRSTKLVFLT